MPAISRYMTRQPFTIPSTSTLSRAREVMLGHAIRHIPVLDGTNLVGLLAQSEIRALSGVPGIDLAHVEVSRVMSSPLTVQGEAPVDEVAELMADTKTDCVVVLGTNGVQGIFTATDALRVLADLLQREAS